MASICASDYIVCVNSLIANGFLSNSNGVETFLNAPEYKPKSMVNCGHVREDSIDRRRG